VTAAPPETGAVPRAARRSARRYARRYASRVVGVGTRPILRLSHRSPRLAMAALRLPGIDDRTRRAQVLRLAERIERDEDPEAVGRLLFAGVAGARAAKRTRIDLMGVLALRQLQAGRVPEELRQVIAGLAGLADVELAARRPASAAEWLDRAAALAFHRTLHFDGLASPLAADPEAFLAPLRASRAWTLATSVRAGRDLPRSTTRAQARSPQRILVVSYRNWNFLTGVLEHLRAHPGVELRTLDLGDLPPGSVPLLSKQQLALRLRGVEAASVPGVAEHIEPHVRWADVVWVEWAQRTASLISMLDPGQARVVVRAHSFEAFTVFPHLTDWSRVDDVVAPSHVGRLMAAAVRGITEGPTSRPLLGQVDLRRFDRPKHPRAERTLALLGWGVVAKDPLWAVELLARLRAEDPDWRLLLVGRDFPEGQSAAAEYRAALGRRIEAPDVTGAVELVPFTDTVPELLEQVGWIVSSSVREGLQTSVLEGAASGAVPVVRDWPIFAPYGGARRALPADWVVADLDAAVARIRRIAGEGRRYAAGRVARDTALERFDLAATLPRLDAMLGLDSRTVSR
jgi:hypothetical protein